MSHWVKGMRDAFFDSLFNLAKKDKDLVLVTSDTGAVCHDEFKKTLPRQYINVGIAEQNMIGVAAGLAMLGKKVYVYAIVPFATMRCYEQIRVDLCCMDLPVNIVGIGAGFDYSTLGPTHHGTEDIALMRALPGMKIYSPADSLAAAYFAKISHSLPGVKYIRLDRTGLPLIYKRREQIDLRKGFTVLKRGKDCQIIATGRMVENALKISAVLAGQFISAGVIDLFMVKPLNREALINTLRGSKLVVSLEEHFITGGLGSSLAEIFAALPGFPRLKIIGIADCFCRRYGSREYLQKINHLDAESVSKQIALSISKAGK
jgi:transketolase